MFSNKNYSRIVELVKRLTKAEKKSVHLFISRYEKAKHYKKIVFEAISKLAKKEVKSCDDTKFINQINNPYISKHQRVIKSDLYYTVLDSLRDNYSSRLIEMGLRKQIDYIEILFLKGLTKQCLSIIKKTKEKAYFQEEYNVLLELLNWEKSVIYRVQNKKMLTQTLSSVLEEEKKIIDIITNLHGYQKISSDMIIYFNLFLEKNSKQLESKMKLLLSYKEMNEVDAALSTYAKDYYYSILSSYYYVKQDVTNVLKVNNLRITLWETHHHLLPTQGNRYLLALSNACTIAVLTSDFKKVSIYITKIKEYQKNIERAKLLNKYKYLSDYLIYQNSLYYCINTGDFSLTNDQIVEIKNFIKDNALSIREDVVYQMYFQIAYIEIADLKFKDCLNTMIDILSKKNLSQKTIIIASVIEIITLYELKKYESVLYKLKKLSSQLINSKNLFEKIIVRVNKRIKNKQTKTIMAFIYQELLKIENMDDMKWMKESFNLLFWTKSKLTDKNLEEITKENLKNFNSYRQ